MSGPMSGQCPESRPADACQDLVPHQTVVRKARHVRQKNGATGHKRGSNRYQLRVTACARRVCRPVMSTPAHSCPRPGRMPSRHIEIKKACTRGMKRSGPREARGTLRSLPCRRERGRQPATKWGEVNATSAKVGTERRVTTRTTPRAPVTPGRPPARRPVRCTWFPGER